MRRLLNKEHSESTPDELGMMQVARNRPIMLPLAVSIGNRRIKPWVVLSGGRTSGPVLALCVLSYECHKSGGPHTKITVQSIN